MNYFSKIKKIFEPEYKVTWDLDGTIITGTAAKNAENLLSEHNIFPEQQSTFQDKEIECPIIKGYIIKESLPY